MLDNNLIDIVSESVCLLLLPETFMGEGSHHNKAEVLFILKMLISHRVETL